MDPDNNMLAEDVIAHLARVFLNKHRRLREDYTIEIISDEPMDEEHVKKSLLYEFNQQKSDIRYALNRMLVKMICLAVLGAALLSLWLYLSANSESVNVEIMRNYDTLYCLKF